MAEKNIKNRTIEGSTRDNFMAIPMLNHKETDRFWSCVDKTDGCWGWKKHLRNGYGKIRFRNTQFLAHRVSYALKYGETPTHLVLDHLCRNRACMKPEHMEAVTRGENVKRGEGVCPKNSRKTHCKHGHEFTPENTSPVPSRNGRRCKTCHREQESMHRKRQRMQYA